MFIQVKKNTVRPIFVEMSGKVIVLNEVNIFASVNFGHCGKSNHIALGLGIFLGSKTKCLDFPQCPQITQVKLLTSKH